ncbi:hypothetical protein ZO98_004627 [Salmonella enterica subsp. salamae]|nr:hypothetical protein [Salmonella enterica subsp. salamae]
MVVVEDCDADIITFFVGCTCGKPIENYLFQQPVFYWLREISALIIKYPDRLSVPPVAVAGALADAGMWFGKSATRKMGGCRPVNMKTNGKRLRRCPDFVSYYNAPHEKTWGASQSERAT